MSMSNPVNSEEDLPKKSIVSTQNKQATDADSGASEGHLGQQMSPDAVSGASVI